MTKGIGRYKKVTKEMIADYNKVVDDSDKLDPKNQERLSQLMKLYSSVDLSNPIIEQNMSCEMCGTKYTGKFFKYIGYFGNSNMTICKPCVSRELFGSKYSSHRIYLFMKSMGVL